MLKTIAQFLQNLWIKLQGNKQVQEFEDFCKQVFTAEKTLLIASLKAFAVSAVATAASTGLDNDAKRKQAFTSIVAQAETAGVAYTASAVALALEMAVTAFKNNQAGNGGNVNG